MAEVTQHMEAYDLPNALKPILPFIDDASNWYVRRSRRRFWKSENDSDKQDAYATLHYVLVQLAHIMAPFTPFLAEELYIKLTGKKSVHLNDWPLPGHVSELVVSSMAAARDVINQGLSQRAQAGIKVRQPLSNVGVVLNTQLNDDYVEIIKEELNVKALTQSQGTDESVQLDINITTELRDERYVREVVRNIQQLRKEAGLQVDDRINLKLESAKLKTAIAEHKDMIAGETLAKKVLTSGHNFAHSSAFELDGHEVKIWLEKA
jgi:isoleucyl-tRNA synthetase